MKHNSEQLKFVNKKLPISTLRNSLISILLAILVMGFNFARTALTSDIFGIDSLGLLTIVLAILPYLSSGHNSLISVSSSKIYSSVYHEQYLETNEQISKLKPQYYLFGSFYLTITIILAFAFPFIVNSNGTIILNSEETNTVEVVKWYESTLFVLSNAIELIATYFIIPISIILLYVSNKSYIYNSINILLTIIFNVLIIVLFVLVHNKTINLSFIEMNIIIFCILGFKSILFLIILYPIRRRIFKWYKMKWLSIRKWRIMKESWQSMLSGYFDQFSTDIVAIVFLVYASLSQSPDSLARHGSHGGNIDNNFIPSSIYTIFLMILTSINEIVHSITDEAIPSVAEHTTFNNQKINKHFFHRYQVLSLFIAIFTSTTYILTSGFLQSIFLDNHGTHFVTFKIMNMLVFLLWIPTIVEIFNSMYVHLLSIIKKFDKILLISSIKAGFNLVVLSIVCAITFTSINQANWIYVIFSAFIITNLIANLIAYFFSRYYCHQIIIHDKCVNIFKSTILSFLYLALICAIMLSIYLSVGDKIIHISDNNKQYVIIIVCVAITLINFVVNLINIYLFRNDDAKFYIDEIKNSWKPKAINKEQVVNK